MTKLFKIKLRRTVVEEAELTLALDPALAQRLNDIVNSHDGFGAADLLPLFLSVEILSTFVVNHDSTRFRSVAAEVSIDSIDEVGRTKTDTATADLVLHLPSAPIEIVEDGPLHKAHETAKRNAEVVLGRVRTGQ
jgi:hypothetical protein